MGHPLELAASLFLHPLQILPKEFRKIAQMPADLRIIFLLQGEEQILPDPVPDEPPREIAPVQQRPDPLSLQVL